MSLEYFQRGGSRSPLVGREITNSTSNGKMVSVYVRRLKIAGTGTVCAAKVV
jgi:hypothetical protein